MSFIDRLNIYTKSQYSERVNFSVEEMQMVGEVQMLETWDDVLRVTEKIYGYCKNEQFELSIGDDFEYDIEGNPLDEDDTDSESDNDYDYEMENGNDGEGKNSDDESDEPTDEESDGESGSDDDSETESESEEDGNQIVHNKESKES